MRWGRLISCQSYRRRSDGPHPPHGVACSTESGFSPSPNGIAGLGRRCSHTGDSGTDSTLRFHEHARGVGSRSLGSFTPSTSQGSRLGRTTLLRNSRGTAQVLLTACRSRLHVAKRRLHRRSGRRSRCVHASSRTQQIGRASWEGRAQRPSIPGSGLGQSPPTEARRPADAPPTK